MIRSPFFCSLTLSAMACCGTFVPSRAQQSPIAASTGVTASARVDALLRQMTLDEKIAIVHGAGESPEMDQGEAGFLPGIPRLHIPPMRLADGPPGILSRVPSLALTSTMGLAATFDRNDAYENGRVIGSQAKARGIAVALQPFINIDRDIEYDRGYNTFGEDPLLTAEMGAAEIAGIQSQRVMAQAKHFIGYDSNASSVVIDDQALHEVYLAPFEAAIKANVSSIMCSYNRINGEYACGNSSTLGNLLKKQLNFRGFVTSDWGATHDADYINAGLDLEMPGTIPIPWVGPSYFAIGTDPSVLKKEASKLPALTDLGLPEEPKKEPWRFGLEPNPTVDLKTLIADGKVMEESVTQAARRILLQMAQFGYLDRQDTLSTAPGDEEAEARIALKTAEDSAVLLKNEKNILPLKAQDLASVAMIGPGAAQLVAVGQTGEKAVGLPKREVGPLEAFKKLAGNNIHVIYASTNDMNGTAIPAELLTHDGKAGLERRAAPSQAVSTDAQIDFTVAKSNALSSGSSAAWTGMLDIHEAGIYRFHLQVLGCYGTLELDGKPVARNGLMWLHGNITQAGQDNIFPTPDGLDNLRAEVTLSPGPHKIGVSIVPDSSNQPEQVRLNWVTPAQQAENYRQAVRAAEQAKTAIVFVWSRSRPVFSLPGDQDKLIADIAAVNPNTIVVMNVAQPVAMPWLDRVKGVLQMWWPGDEGGWATAKVLLGAVSPAGRLPTSWPKRLEDAPATDPAHPERSARGVDGKTTFSEGVLVGYRWFDRRGIEPLFPFGFGLSYAQFDYSDLHAARGADGGVDVEARVRNAGRFASDEVAQVYIGKPESMPKGAQFADRILGGFERFHLEPGQSRLVKIHVPLRQLQYWSSENQTWVTPTGAREISIGPSSRDLKLKAAVQP